MDSSSSNSDSQPHSATAKLSIRISRDACRKKKVRCDGARPTCSRCNSSSKGCVYSQRMPMGRPRSRHTVVQKSQSYRSARLLCPTPPANQHLRTDIEAGERDVEPVVDSTTASTLPQDLPTRVTDIGSQFIPSPLEVTTPQLSSTLAGQPDGDRCACISVLYLILEQLQVKTQWRAPDDLILLRSSITRATSVLDCPQCPQRFFCVIQNAVFLGVVCMCIAECYARIVGVIEEEESQASRAGLISGVVGLDNVRGCSPWDSSRAASSSNRPSK
ncbi:Zn(II)2Cys6 transcription factor domain-containing protein [Aspergillus alliaceus]|uniref:Zn(II)2Cys6 transcription factor domain-containing protein n=1 Tax=Petromyces alliaceus TaxID=209559 RepID=UPI0012A6A454|nr:uncharacterized protein BDW43DRAFT_148878 [Aspergillus alliaceus]KAB8230848.1 hypothetical protein BDW43DRAFT_148878 [Aspergillus alliaceus]